MSASHPSTSKRPRDGVVVFGEVLCDLFAERPGQALAEAPRLYPRPGGAPANVSVQLARLGVPVALISAVGADPFGARLIAGLGREGVDTGALVTRPGRRTGATLVEVDADGQRRFFGFREQSADLSLDVDDVRTTVVQTLLARARVVHTGTVSLSTASARRATAALLQQARQVTDGPRRRGTTTTPPWVSLDVNLRPGMYPSTATMLTQACRAVARADLVKATVEEATDILAALEGRRRRRTSKALAEALRAHGPAVVVITDEHRPTVLAAPSGVVQATPPVVKRVVDATGAGDAFWGACVAQLVSLPCSGLADVDAETWSRILARANHAGARAVTALGATTAMVRRLPGWRRSPSLLAPMHSSLKDRRR